MVNVYLLKGLDEAQRSVRKNDITIAIDVIRCSSTIISGFQNGVEQFIPLSSIKDVQDVLKRNPEYLTAGERNGVKVSFFNFGNSPTELVIPSVKGKTVVITTSNGTPLIRLGMDVSRKLLVGALINYQACAKKAQELAIKSNSDVKILIPMTKRGECIEDLYAAGLIVKNLSLEGFIPRWDSTKISILMAEMPTQHIIKELRHSQSAQRVEELGYSKDISYSLQMNTTTIVPQSRNSSISLDE